MSKKEKGCQYKLHPFQFFTVFLLFTDKIILKAHNHTSSQSVDHEGKEESE
jgi:hypothetical protein